MSSNVIELRLPLRREYLPVLRATLGVIAGISSFDYDQIVHLRVAVSEVYDLAIKHVIRSEQDLEPYTLTARFALEDSKIETLIIAPIDYAGFPSTDEERESEALIHSLMDEVEIGFRCGDASVVRLVKYRSAERDRHTA